MQQNKFYAHHKKKKSVYKVENSPELFLEGRECRRPLNWRQGKSSLMK